MNANQAQTWTDQFGGGNTNQNEMTPPPVRQGRTPPPKPLRGSGERDERERRAVGPRCVLIGVPTTIIPLHRQLLTLCPQPEVVGVILLREEAESVRREIERYGLRVMGLVKDLAKVVSKETVDLGIVTLPAAMSEAVAAIRTTLRRIGVPDRFIATLEDQVAGIGPRSVFEVDTADLINRRRHEIDERTVRESIGGKRVLITGAGGSIGSELARMVARYEPAALYLMERAENALFEIDRQIARQHPKLSRGAWLHDVTETKGTLEYCAGFRPQIVFHAAAHKHVPMMEDHPAAAVRNNFFGTKAIADAAAKCGADRFVMISTDKAVNPSSIMGATKRLAELYVQGMSGRSDTRFAMVRFGNVLGSAGSVLGVWADQIRDGGPVTVTHPEMVRYFMTIPEAAALVIQAAALDECLAGGEVLLLDMGEPIRIVDLAKRFVRAHGLEAVVQDGEGAATGNGGAAAMGAHAREAQRAGMMPIVFTGVRPGEKLFEELAYAAEDMLPTAHPGIRIWQTRSVRAGLVEEMVTTLGAACETQSAEMVSEAIRRLLGAEMKVAAKRAGTGEGAERRKRTRMAIRGLSKVRNAG